MELRGNSFLLIKNACLVITGNKASKAFEDATSSPYCYPYFPSLHILQTMIYGGSCRALRPHTFVSSLHPHKSGCIHAMSSSGHRAVPGQFASPQGHAPARRTGQDPPGPTGPAWQPLESTSFTQTHPHIWL